mgnify:CR=1 FL=1
MEQIPYQEKIKGRVLALAAEELTEEERAVMAMLWTNFNVKKITQLEIARTERWMGCHPTHEADIRANKMDTTTRQVRQIIRDLRIKWEVPILSDRLGYWLPTSEAEAADYITSLEREVVAQITSWRETYNAMKHSLNSSSSLLDQLPLL